jgi:uncharacterized Zn-binding protein involved in type VI secretion
MMPAVQRMTDANDGGGVLDLIPQAFVRVDGLVVAVVGAQGTAHPPCPTVQIHCAHVWATTRGAPRVRINGMPVIRTTDPDTCGHRRVVGSSSTRIGDGGGAPGGPNDWDSGDFEGAEWQ